MNADERGVTAILRRYQGDPGNSVVTSGDMVGAGALHGSDVLSDDDLGIGEEWERAHHPDATTDQPILVKTEQHTGLAAAEEVRGEDHTNHTDRLPGSAIELFYPNGDKKTLANADLVACRGPVPDHQNRYRVPIQREIGEVANESDPDHIRGAKYANLLFGTDYGRGDTVEMVYLDRIDDGFFQRVGRRQPALVDDALYRSFKRDLSAGRGVVSVDDTGLLPPEFSRDPMKSPEAGQ